MNIGVAIISPHLSRWHWLKVFCKDNRLVLIEECLFAEASSANAGAWALEALPSSPGVIAHLHLKQHTQNQRVWAHTLKVAILTSYKNLSVGYSELIFHIYALGTSDTYFTSCKKGHNRSPLRYFWWNPRAFWHRTQMCCVLFTSRGMHMLWYCRERASKSNTEENNLLNKVIIFVLFAHKKYSCSSVQPNHWCHVDYFNDVLTTFLGLECVSCIAVYAGQKALRFHQKYLNVFRRWTNVLQVWNNMMVSK